MTVPFKLKERIRRLLHWEYNTTQLLVFFASLPLFLIAGVLLSYYFPVVSFVVALLYLFIILPSVIMAATPPPAWRAPMALLHSFVFCWAVAGLFPLDEYLRLLLL